jgi:glycosyltransferase involved in cell wall biosynthesis
VARILFIHDNFPAQFGGLAGWLAQRGWDVVFATAADKLPADRLDGGLIKGVRVVRYKGKQGTRSSKAAITEKMDRAVQNGKSFVRIGASLNRKGFVPDVIVAHSGWGSGSFARTIWPQAKFVQYLEWWYNSAHLAGKTVLGPRKSRNSAARTLCDNLPFLLDAQTADAILVPTKFQAAQVPAMLKPRIHVLHDGVDANLHRPERTGDPKFTWDALPETARIVTYATRGMEPMRGFPAFMAAWAQVQHEWPDVHCVIAGSDRVCYGASLPDGESYKAQALNEHNFDMARLHFTGLLARDQYRALLRRSSAHVYLTQPFVLSWSLIESMMSGAPLVASDCPPVLEAAPTGTAAYTKISDPTAIAAAISGLLKDPVSARNMGLKARDHAVAHYSADKLWPRHEAFLRDLIVSTSSAEPIPVQKRA